MAANLVVLDPKNKPPLTDDLFLKDVFIDEIGRVLSTYLLLLKGTGWKSPNFRIVNSDIIWNFCVQDSPNDEEYTLFLHSSKKENVSNNFRYFSRDSELLDSYCFTSEHDERIISRIPHDILSFGSCMSVKMRPSEGGVIRKDQCKMLMEDFGHLLSDGKFSDFVIETGDGTRIPVHRNVLSARSSVFSAMLDSDMAEKNSGYLKIDHFKSPAVKDMINYLYTGRLPELPFKTVWELLKVADFYCLKMLKQICVEKLERYLFVKTAPDILLIAEEYNEESLKSKVLQFISENRISFNDRENFHHVLMNKPSLLLDVISCMAAPE